MIIRSFAYQTVGVNVITIKEKRSLEKRNAGTSSINASDFPEQSAAGLSCPAADDSCRQLDAHGE